jgi:NAD(P)-dependent dehydrogenase (short-subunit alcohol dehydrogenase family)
MSEVTNGTVVITGPTGGLGRELALSIASRAEDERPDLLLVGRPSKNLEDITELARKAGATAFGVSCDLSVLSDVRAASQSIKDTLASGNVRSLHGIVANAGLSSMDTRKVSADGYELTLAVNYLGHALLINELADAVVAPGRIVMVGSNTYWQNGFRKMLHVAPATWDDLTEMVKPARANTKPNLYISGTAYSNSKLALLYYAHELQRHVKDGIHVIVFEPGFMPGTGLGRGAGEAAQAVARMIGRIPGVSTPKKSGAIFASVVLDDKWSQLHDGAFVVKDKLTEVQPFARNQAREQRLWEATTELLNQAK